jgi:hypothetical protein
MAFATYNAMLQSAMGSINPYKQLSELELTDIFGIMVSWLKHEGEPLISYDDRKQNVNSVGAPTFGAQEIITTDMLPDPENFYATVKLTEYVPSDEMGKINAMTMLVQNLTYPTARALEAIDVTDPRTAIEEWGVEQKTKASVMEEVKDIQFEADLIRQKRTAQMQMQLQQQQQAQQAQQPPAQPDQGGGMPSPDMSGGMPPDPSMQAPFENASGQGFAGNFGGSSPLQAAPDMTGVGLPAMEGRDNRGLRMPPEGRLAVQ